MLVIGCSSFQSCLYWLLSKANTLASLWLLICSLFSKPKTSEKYTSACYENSHQVMSAGWLLLWEGLAGQRLFHDVFSFFSTWDGFKPFIMAAIVDAKSALSSLRRLICCGKICQILGLSGTAFSSEGLLLSGHRGDISCSVSFSVWSDGCAGVTSAVCVSPLFSFERQMVGILGETKKRCLFLFVRRTFSGVVPEVECVSHILRSQCWNTKAVQIYLLNSPYVVCWRQSND